MYRGVILPTRALSSVLAGMSRRLMALEHRIRWPGATQFAEDTGVNVVENDSLIYTTLVTLDLDPGRWLVLAGTNITQVGTAEFRLNIEITDTIHPSAATFYGAYVLGGTVVPLVTFGVLELSVATTITFQAYYIVYAGTGTATANDVYLIATPT